MSTCQLLDESFDNYKNPNSPFKSKNNEYYNYINYILLYFTILPNRERNARRVSLSAYLAVQPLLFQLLFSRLGQVGKIVKYPNQTHHITRIPRISQETLDEAFDNYDLISASQDPFFSIPQSHSGNFHQFNSTVIWIQLILLEGSIS